MQAELNKIEQDTADLLGELGLTRPQQQQVMRIVTTKLVGEYHENIRRNNEQRRPSTQKS